MRFAAIGWTSAAAFTGVLALSTVAGAQQRPLITTPQQPLTAVPQPGANPTANVVLDAMMAVARAAATNPQAAQGANLAYRQAVQSYNLGDFQRARTEAIAALIAANRPAMSPIPVLQSTIPQLPLVPSTPFLLPGATIAQTDADFFVAQARGAVASCMEAKSAQTAAAQASLALAERDDAAGRYVDARRAARAAVERCAITSASP